MSLVKADGTLSADVKDVSAHFTPTVSTAADGRSVITWKANTDKGLKDFAPTINDTDNYRIIIEYYPLYTQDEIKALYGNLSDGTPDVNDVHLNFSNDYKNDSSMGKTPNKETKVYDFNLVVKKLGSDSGTNPLKGASFTLTQADGTDVGHTLTPTQGENGYFYWTGLDADVDYTLTETTAPSGYRKVQPVTFRFTATYDAANNQAPTVSVSTSKNPSSLTVEMLDTTKDEVPLPNGSGNVAGTTANVTSLITVIDTLGPDLPLTGMSGIWAGIILGLVVIGGSAYFIIRNRRKAAEAEEDENEQK